MTNKRRKSPSEKKIQSKILNYLKNHCWAVKVVQANMRGCPDILCCYQGEFFAFEVKRAGSKASPIQREQINSIMNNGGRAYTVYSLKEVKEILK